MKLIERSAIKDQGALDNAARLALETGNAAATVRRLATTEEVKDAAQEAICLSNDTMNACIKAGAAPPMGRPAPRGDKLDLSALVQLDTPDARELLVLLERAQAVAERVDASRGRAFPAGTPLLPGESLGTDLAESLSLITLRVRLEVEGPKGRE